MVVFRDENYSFTGQAFEYRVSALALRETQVVGDSYWYAYICLSEFSPECCIFLRGIECDDIYNRQLVR